MPKKIDAEIQLVIIEGKQDERLTNIKNLKVIELPPFFHKIKNLFIEGLIFQVYALLYCLKLKDLKIVYSRYTTINIADILVAKFRQIPLITEVNGIYRYEKERTFPNKVKIVLNEFLAKILFKNSARIITVTDKLKQFVNKEYGISNNKIKVVYNGVETELFYPINQNKCRAKLQLDHESNIVCFIGGLAIWQGVEYIINSAPQVLSKIPKTIFLIVGSGYLEKRLKGKVKNLNISGNFIFTGWAPHNMVPLYINASDICMVLKKSFAMGYSPIKLYEYMACGKPVIGTNISGIDVIEKNNAGIIVNPTNTTEIAEAILKLLKNQNLREQMGKNGRKLVLEKYTWDINANKVSEICKEFI